MNKPSYNNQVITEYLLGSLPDEQAEQFDELSFIDDDFADELKAAERDLIDAYLQGELQNPTLEKFKSYYLASPLRREKVRFAQAFQTVAEKNINKTNSEVIKTLASKKPKGAGFFSMFNIFAAPSPALQWGFAAATLAFMFFGGWMFYQNLLLQNQINETQARRTELQQREAELQNEIANQRSTASEKEEELSSVREELARLEKEQDENKKTINEQEQQRLAGQRADTPKKPSIAKQISVASVVLAPQLRAGKQIQTISLPERTDAVAMQLELEADDYPAYRVALQNQENKAVWQSGKLKTKTRGGNKTLSVSFPAALLKSQVYSLEVSGISPNGTAETVTNYTFKVVR